MTALTIVLECDGQWADMAGKNIIHVPPDRLQIGTLAGGMQSGRPSVAFRVDLADGSVVFVETSVALFLTAADAIKARHGDQRQ